MCLRVHLLTEMRRNPAGEETSVQTLSAVGCCRSAAFVFGLSWLQGMCKIFRRYGRGGGHGGVTRWCLSGSPPSKVDPRISLS